MEADDRCHRVSPWSLDQSQGAFQQRKAEPAGQPNDDDARISTGRVSQRLREILVQCDETAALGGANRSAIDAWR
jgi:hypothetical protein